MPVARPEPRRDVSVQPDGDAAFLLDPLTGQYYELNPTAHRIWGLLVGGADESEVTRALCAEFEVDEGTAGRSLAEFLRTLRSEGLLVGTRPPTPLRRILRRLRGR